MTTAPRIALATLALVLIAVVARLALVERSGLRAGSSGDAGGRVAPGPIRTHAPEPELRGATAELVPAERPPEAPARAEEVSESPAAHRAPRAARSPDALAEWLRTALPDRYGKLTVAELLALEELDLRGADVTAAELEALAALPALRTLSLRGTPIDDAALLALRGLPLEHLDLRGTRVSGDAFAGLPSRSLRALHLTDTDVTEADLARLPPMPGLETLKLNRLALTDDALDALAIYPGLRHVELDGTRLTDAGLLRLLALNPGIRRIEARDTLVTHGGVEALRHVHPDCEVVFEQPQAALLRSGR